jgi:D-alanine-D-alanine ligase-like ATP-grasp enzyme
LKALILNRPKAGKVFEDERKFGLLARILQNGGISANYYPMYNEIQLVNTLAREKIDIAFSADYYLIGKSNTKVNIHSLFEELHLPYIGSSPDVLELVLSKSLLKKVWQENGVKHLSLL